MNKTVFKISKMDCPSEENLIRMKLHDIPAVKKLEFDLSNRVLEVYHLAHFDVIEKAIDILDLNSKRISSESIDFDIIEEDTNQSKLLWTVLLINFVFFLIEMSTGIVSKSMGLVADSLDMLADSFVYGLSLLAVGSTHLRKKKVAKLAGYFQVILAVIGFLEVIRRFFRFEALPNFTTMIIVSSFALIANGICLYLLQKSKSNEAHMKASMIFTSNDIIINIGVIVAAFLVHLFNSGTPDLIIGIVVFIAVIQGALRILKLSK